MFLETWKWAEKLNEHQGAGDATVNSAVGLPCLPHPLPAHQLLYGFINLSGGLLF